MKDNQDFVGTRWYKCDFHLHTLASKCFRDRTVTPKQWVDKAIDMGLHCVAITDHNSAEMIDIIKTEAENTNLIVFPGVEITCSDAKVHLLIIFDVDKGKTEVEDFLLVAGIDRPQFGQETAFSNKSLTDILELADKKGALVIPAHIDEFNSIANAGYGNRDEFLKNKSINAVQVVHKELVTQDLSNQQLIDLLSDYYNKPISDDQRRDWTGAVRQAISNNKTILTFSDNPDSEGDSKHGLWGIGRRFTWIKMNQKVNLESLRHALLLPKFRVRNDFVSFDDPYKLPDLWIESLKVFNTEITTGVNPLLIEFSPQLTTIIGGRGTGKSSVLRFLRGIFNKTADLNSLESILTEQKDFFKIKESRDNKGILQNGSIIEVLFNRNGVKYKIRASDFNKGTFNTSIEEWSKANDCFEKIELEGFIDFFKFDVFSQKQIYEIAQTPNALRDRIDITNPSMKSLKNSLKETHLMFLEKTAQLRTLQQRISQKNKLETEIIDSEKRINSFNESGFEGAYREQQIYKDEEQLLVSYKEQLLAKKKILEETLNGFGEFHFKADEFSSRHRNELNEFFKVVEVKISQIKNDLFNIKDKLDLILEESEANLNKSEWKRNLSEINSVFQIKKEEMANRGINDLRDIESLHNLSKQKKQELKKIFELELEFKDELVKKNAIKQKYLEIRMSITESRRKFVFETLDSDTVKIEIKPFRDIEFYRSNFRTLIQRESGFEDDVDRLIQMLSRGNIENQVDKINTLFSSLRNNEAIEQKFGLRFQTLIKSISESQLDELELLYPEDDVIVSYKPNSASGFKLLSNASAGQKTSAILTFILSQGDIPILLDQPEDDLDNHLIYELIVKRLRKSKEHRQIIIVTHNANIPVNGDAEVVVALNPEIKTVGVLYSGAIEEESIKKEICEVMEGGEMAFKLRSERYNFN